MTGETWTIKTVIDWATDHFNKNGIENPHLEAEILLASALHSKRIDLYVNFEKVLGPDELARFRDLIIRRKKHEPTAYITGTRAFMSLDFKVTRDVLIPRPETELLVETTIDHAKDLDAPHILDIGTGSGAIAVSLAKYLPKAKIHATDISEKALLIAKQNADIHKVADRITFEATDLFSKVPSQYDLIISNPPYIRTADIETLAPEVKDHEPRAALDGGEDGMKYYLTIIQQASQYLNRNGVLLLEIDPSVRSSIELLAEKSGYKDIKVKKDLNGFDRVAVLSMIGQV